MKRKLIALTMAGMLALGATPAAAQEQPADMSAQAEEATRKVKQTLSIGDEYQDFHSEYQENNGNPRWSLFWTGEDGASLTVEATAQGKVLGYNLRLPSQETRYDGSFAPQVPKLDNAKADQIAQEFLSRVLTDGESVQLQGTRRRSGERVYYSFDISLNGLPSPLSGRLYLDDGQGQVVSFWRTDSGEYLGGIPSASPKIQSQAGQQTLREADQLRLEYAAAEKGEQARLRYVPVSQDVLAVDAQSGRLLNLTEMRLEAMKKGMSGGAKNESASADMAAPAGAEDGGLSRAEQQGIDKLKNVMSAGQLEAKLRAMPELALEGFQLEDSSYYYNKEQDLYTCRMSYQKKEGEKAFYKNLTIDAQTGALQNFYGYGPEEQEYLEGQASLAKAQAFMSGYFARQSGQVAPYQSADSYEEEGTLLVRQHQNIPYPSNYYRFVFDKQGALVSFSSQWEEEAQFDSPEGAIGGQAALKSWQKARPAELAYASVPEAQGDRYYSKLLLVYQYGQKAQDVYAVDAKTGEALIHEEGRQDEISYTDATAQDKEILALAQLGVGYKSQTFDKKKALTQADMLSFLVSANGGYYDPQQKDQLDVLYETAYDLGMLSRGQRDENAPVTRIQLIKTLLDMSGYGKAARISGVFTCSFTDADSIAPENYGYAAMAQGLGVVRGDGAGRLSPESQATREQMAIMMYNFMNRA